MDSATERLALFMLQTVIAGNGISVIGDEVLENETIIGLRSQVMYRSCIKNAAVTIAKVNAPNQKHLII